MLTEEEAPGPGSEEIDLPDPVSEDNDLYEHYRFTVDKGQAQLRIDKFLMGHIQNASRNKIQNAAKAGNILVNAVAEKPNYKVKPLDLISIVLAYPPRDTEIVPENIPIDVVYEDDDVLVINKLPGMVVHPGFGNYTGTLVNALAYKFGIPKGATERGPFLVHRIDKDTSGIMLVAKNELAQTRLARNFFDHTIERKYQALVWGNFDEDGGTITGHIARNPRDRMVMAVFTDGSVGKHAVTHYKVLKRFNYVTLIECTLETGRTHQIRAHMKFAGHPLFNDARYGGNEILRGTTFSRYRQFIQNCFTLLPRQALHAKSLGFKHPSTGEFMFFDSAIPDDMQAVLDKWDRYVAAGNAEAEE